MTQMYYDRISDSPEVYDRVILDLQDMADNASNPRQRVLAGQCMHSLQAVRQVAEEMKRLSASK